jgi:hypothetical protein
MLSSDGFLDFFPPWSNNYHQVSLVDSFFPRLGPMSLDSGTVLELETHNVGDLHITRNHTPVTARAEMKRNSCQCAADASPAGGVGKPSTSLPHSFD